MPATLPSVFLSYARSDDEAFVGRLYARLTAAGFRVWWDRVSMPSRSLTFLHEIRDAIDAHDRMIVVLGPAAAASAYVRAEWQYALAADKMVSPVLRLGSLDLLPAELDSLHCVNALAKKREESETFSEVLRIAHDPQPPLGRAFHVPAPPPHFQPRVDQFTRLAQLLMLKEARRLVLSPAERTVVLQGMGGLGKSVLAASVARAPSTRRLFADGVVWLGFNPEDRSALAQLQALGHALGDDLREYSDEKRAAEQARRRLETAAVLVVLDNAWWDEQVHPFRHALGRRCQLLVTTRDAGIATRVGAELLRLELLSQDESLRLLGDWVGMPPEALPALVHPVAAECRGLPFALALAGAMAAGGTGWADLAEALAAADLAFVHARFPDYPYADLLRAQTVSLQVMQQSGDPVVVRAARKYLELSAFRWDRPVPESALVTRWLATDALSEREAREVLTVLASKALLRTEGASPDRRVWLHDLQHDFLRARVPDEKTEHAALLRAYETRFPGAPLAAVDDGYYFDNLFLHLERAGRGEAMHDLLYRATDSGANAWWEARIARGQAFGYEADLRRAWADATARLSAQVDGFDPALIVRSVRYALMSGSIRDALAAVPATLVRSLLQFGLWTAEQALAAARWQPGYTSRAAALADVLPWLNGTARRDAADDALAIIASFPEPGDEARYLLRVADGLEREQRMPILQRAVERIGADQSGSRVEYLTNAWKACPEKTEWLDAALDALAATMERGTGRFAIESLARAVPPAAIGRLVALARGLHDAADRASALVTLASVSPLRERASLAAEACEAAQGTRPEARLGTLAKAVRWLSANSRRKVARELLDDADASPKPQDTLAVLAAVLPALDADERTAVEKRLASGIAHLRSAEIVSSLLEEFASAGGLQEVAPTVAESLLEPLIEAARRDDSGYFRAKALSTLATLVPPPRGAVLIAEEAGRVQRIEDHRDRAQCLMILCEKPDPAARDQEAGRLLASLIAEEARRAQRVEDQWYRAQCLITLCEKLDPAGREQEAGRLLALPVIARGERLGIARDLAGLMRMATPDQLEAASEAVRSTNEPSALAAAFAIGFAHHARWERVYEMLERTEGAYDLEQVFEAFPGQVPLEVARTLISGCVATRDAEMAAAAIPPLIRHLAGEEKAQHLSLALHALDYLTNCHDRTRLVQAIVPELSCEQTQTVHRRLTDKPEDFEEDPHTLRARLAIRLCQCGRPDQAVPMLSAIDFADVRAQALAEIAALPGPLQGKFAQWAEITAEHAWPDSGVQTLAHLASSRGKAERERLLAKAEATANAIQIDERSGALIDPRETKARALLYLAPYLAEDRRRAVLLEAWRLASKATVFSSKRALRELSPQLATLALGDLLGPWQEDLAAAARSRAAVLDVLACLPDVIVRLGGQAAVQGIVGAVNDVARWWPDR